MTWGNLWYEFRLRWRMYFLMPYIRHRIKESGRAVLIPGFTCGRFRPRFALDFSRIVHDIADLCVLGICDDTGEPRWIVVAHNASTAWYHSNRIARGFLDIRRKGQVIDDVPAFLERYEQGRVGLVELYGVQLEEFNILGETYAFGKEGD